MKTNASNIIRLSDIKMGQCFQFETNGPVYIKCRGGFRLALGGALHDCAHHVIVLPYGGVK